MKRFLICSLFAFYWLHAQDKKGGASYVNTFGKGAAAVSRSVEDKLRETVSVKDYGAHGIGTDDTHAIQAALDATGAAGGGTVYVPPGTYLLHAHPVVPSYVVLAGAGDATTIKVADNEWPVDPADPDWKSLTYDIPAALVTASGATHAGFRDFTLDMNGANQTYNTYGTSLALENAIESIVERVQVINAWHLGQMIGLYGTAGYGNTVRGNFLIGPGVANPGCVTNQGPGGGFIQNPETLVDGNYATTLCDEAFIANGPLALDVTFSNNTVARLFSRALNAPTAFHAEDSSRTKFLGNTCIGFATSCFNAAPTGVSGSNMTDITFIGNSCAPDSSGHAPKSCMGWGTDTSGHTVTEVTATGNMVRGATHWGIVIGGAHSVVKNNIVRLCDVGILVQGAATDSVVTDNVLTANIASDLSLPGGVPPTRSLTYPNVLTATATTNTYIGAKIQDGKLQQLTTIGEDTGGAFSALSARVADGILRFNTNLNPDNNTSLFDAAKPGWSLQQDSVSDFWCIYRKPVGAGAPVCLLSIIGSTGEIGITGALTGATNLPTLTADSIFNNNIKLGWKDSVGTSIPALWLDGSNNFHVGPQVAPVSAGDMFFYARGDDAFKLVKAPGGAFTLEPITDGYVDLGTSSKRFGPIRTTGLTVSSLSPSIATLDIESADEKSYAGIRGPTAGGGNYSIYLPPAGPGAANKILLTGAAPNYELTWSDPIGPANMVSSTGGTTYTIPVFSGAQSIADSILTVAGSTVLVSAGDGGVNAAVYARNVATAGGLAVMNNTYYSAGWKRFAAGYPQMIGLDAAGGLTLNVAATGAKDSAITWNQIVIDPSGNVGIGTTVPGAKLEVAGSVIIAGTLTGATNMVTTDTTQTISGEKTFSADIVVGGSVAKDIKLFASGDANWRVGMSATPGFTKALATSYTTFLTYAAGTNEGFAIGVQGGNSSFEIRGSDHLAYFRGGASFGGNVGAASFERQTVTAGTLLLNNNAYYDAGWKRFAAGFAERIDLIDTGGMTLNVAATGAKDSAISWITSTFGATGAWTIPGGLAMGGILSGVTTVTGSLNPTTTATHTLGTTDLRWGSLWVGSIVFDGTMIAPGGSGIDATLDCGTARLKSITVSKGIVTAVSCGT